ncbi:SEC-C metal-binding domain-containing protein [Halioglobus sp. HI00S01]|uniref:SEC-C metal-binding domain-containing protein n=1 Tax=Halioglobus sp. HI00S01 TaxID=1822214 RepID=UPI0009EF238E|nr:SEC-C metal-binding domain-containing protein [Halioglobus sp. HI00S01]
MNTDSTDFPTPNFANTVTGGCSDTSCCPPPEPVTRLAPKVGRNDPCPCGSERKFKKCCGRG